jgi:carboxymethylenebutenolidase
MFLCISESCGSQNNEIRVGRVALPSNRSVAQKLEETLAGTGIAHDVKEYPEAGHSFLNNHETSFFKLLQIIHIAYDEPAAKDARRRIVSFFRGHLDS